MAFKCKICNGSLKTNGHQLECNRCFAVHSLKNGSFVLKKFMCKVCKETVSIQSVDESFYRAHHWECNGCYSIIYKKRYEPKNSGVTVVTPIGNSLGDKVMFEVPKQEYIKANPDEKIIFLNKLNDLNDIYQHNPDKVFWANIATDGFERPDNAYWFSVVVESYYYFLEGHHERLWFEPEYLGSFDYNRRYVVVHFRNMTGEKDCGKNTPEVYAAEILALLQLKINSNELDAVVVVGNDTDTEDFSLIKAKATSGFYDDGTNFYDLRNKLSLPKLAGLCKRAKFYVGPDSGPMHIAAGAGCPHIIAWGFTSEGWFPRIPKKQMTLFMKPISTISNVLFGIRRQFQIKINENRIENGKQI